MVDQPGQLALAVQQLTHTFALRTVLQDISFELPSGQTVALVGPSGCGKSTLLHVCAGLLDVQHGQVQTTVDRMATLFQQPHLLPWKTALDNIALGLKAAGIRRSERLAMSHEMGLSVGLSALSLAQFPHQLSGGMQSRVALARALVLSPELLLLDEPFSALDIGLKAHMHELLLAQQAERRLSVLMITHDLHEAVRLADTVLVMAAEPGRLVWRLDLPVPARERDEAWIHRHTAALMAQQGVREAFGLPPLPVHESGHHPMDGAGVLPRPLQSALPAAGVPIPPSPTLSRPAGRC
ncbi:MAG: ATP-binding cassette domain-containing protein [Lautropia sp.]|nr:ATP-binding cassette domain-containing protein [Lautropia sp.]